MEGRGCPLSLPVARCHPFEQRNRISTTFFGRASKVMDNAVLMRGQQHFCGSIEFIGT
jgi:hypothetical protein